MPLLPFPLPLTPGAPDPCVRTLSDVEALLPREYKTEAHPVLAALLTGLLGMAQEYEARADYAAALSDITRSIEAWLDGLGEDRGTPRALAEDDETYRARMLGWQDVVTPEAIIAAINGILASYTTGEAAVCETILDRWYVETGTAVWGSFVGDDQTITLSPQYFDRLYEDDSALNDGLYRPQSAPGEPLVFQDDYGRAFFVRVPEINDANGPTAYAEDGTATVEVGAFVETGTALVEMTFVSNDYLIADEIYQAIINAVNRIKGQGIRWTLWVDPRL